MKYILILLLAVALTGCDTNMAAASVTYGDLPRGSTELTNTGNGWYTFKYQTKCYAVQQLFVVGSSAFNRVIIETDCLTPAI